MAKNLRFKASTSPDVVGYRMYFEEVPNEVTYDSEYADLGNDVNAEGYVVVDLSTVARLTGLDGVYNIGVTAIDDGENESSMSKAADVPLDFVAPEPPGALEMF
jgi:hypothetical protein